jgi:hypothetical protein
LSLWKAIQQRLWTGPVVKDYGTISDRSMGRQRRTLSAVLSEKEGRRLYLRESWRAFAAARINFIELDRDEALRLREILDDALAQMRPPSEQGSATGTSS